MDSDDNIAAKASPHYQSTDEKGSRKRSPGGMCSTKETAFRVVDCPGRNKWEVRAKFRRKESI